MYCEYCGSGNLVFLGTLGFHDHFRCRDCGMNVTDESVSEDTDDGFDDYEC